MGVATFTGFGEAFEGGVVDFGFGSAGWVSSLSTLPSSCLEASSPAMKPSRNAASGARGGFMALRCARDGMGERSGLGEAT